MTMPSFVLLQIHFAQTHQCNIMHTKYLYMLQTIREGALILSFISRLFILHSPTTRPTMVIDCDGLWVGWTGLHDFNPAIEKIPESDADDRAPTAGLLSRQAISGDFPSFLFQNLFKRMF